MVAYFIFHVIFLSIIYHYFGTGGIRMQFLYSFFGIVWVEMVNYLEHYGLAREKDSNGILESVGYMHSW